MVAGRCVPAEGSASCSCTAHPERSERIVPFQISANGAQPSWLVGRSPTSRGIGDSWHVLYLLLFEVLDRASRSCCNLHFAIMERSVVSELGSGKSSLERP